MVTIIKRDGEKASFNPNKILNRIKKASKGLKVNSEEIFVKVMTSLPTEGSITTTELDKLVADIAAAYTGSHPDYSKLAASVSISSHHKVTKESFYDTMKDLADKNIISQNFVTLLDGYGKEAVDRVCKYERDFNYDYFGWRSLEEMYLLRISEDEILERPQHMYFRIALWLTDSLEEAIEYYESLSNQLTSSATPITLNSAKPSAQLASCVLHYNDGDSKEGLLNTLRDISNYSADAAGIGLCLSNIRSGESIISTSGGKAGGLLKFCKIVNESLRFFNQQGRRPGSAAIYIEPWHKDILDLLDIKKQTGKDELRARDIFTALWVPDNFMRAVEKDTEWYLFCPNDIKKAGLKALQDCYGEEYEQVYNEAVSLGLGKKIQAQEIWRKILESQIETGVPYLCAKDSANAKTNHKNIGVIHQSNLCAEIFQATDEQTTAICTLSSLVLKNYIKEGKFDYNLLAQETKRLVRGLNRVIDINHYSTEKGRKGGLEQRAIGIGVQGLADVFFILDLIFTSEEAKKINKQIFETIYYAALQQSMELCKSGKYKPYQFFEGSEFSKGIVQFDMWGLTSTDLSGMWDWDQLKKDIQEFGLANSLVTAAMPVASSAKITGSFEMMEPAHSGIFARRVLGGEITIINGYLVKDLEELGLWSEQMKNELIVGEGSLKTINFNKYLDPDTKNYSKKVERIQHLIEKYKTIWEIKQRELIDMAADRAPFIDQSQSMNIYMAEPTATKLTSSHIYGWKKGLKTLCYYVRTKAISTGAKHLAIDVSGNAPLPPKPSNSEFDCVGCSA